MKNTPYWWDIASPPKQFEQSELPSTADVLVIGAGLTGLSASRTLAKAGKSVVCVDAGAPGIGASARNGGMIGGGHRVPWDKLVAQYDKQTAADLTRELHIDSMEFAKSLMADEGIDCDYSETGRLQALWRASEYESVARNFSEILKSVPISIEMIPKSKVRDHVSTDMYGGGAIYHHHGGLNPAKWMAGIRDAAVKAGAKLQGNTPVVAIERTGASIAATTPQGIISAGQVLIATNGYTRRVLGSVSRRVFPVPSFIVVSEELGENRVRSMFPSMKMIVETRARHCYFRPSPDGKRLLFGGRAAMFAAPERFVQNQMRDLMTGIFPEMRNAELTHSWRGNTGFTFELLPNVGQTDGIWHALGYCGNGNGMAPWLGHKAAQMMLGEPEGETAFSKTKLAARWWYGGWPWFLPFADVLYRFKDQLNRSKR